MSVCMCASVCVCTMCANTKRMYVCMCVCMYHHKHAKAPHTQKKITITSHSVLIIINKTICYTYIKCTSPLIYMCHHPLVQNELNFSCFLVCIPFIL